MLFALLSDAWLGRYKTMLFSLALIVIGYTVLFVTALPSSLEHGAGLGGLIAMMILTGLEQRGLSAIMYHFIVKLPPQGNILPQAGRVLLIATRSKFHLSAADPQYQIQHYNHSAP
ncbi:hypothetical protein BCON_0136g00230 [Botryotinia convoluta]|uniref:Uncharacterized protein n=1 Tax=Botryotinia convoluta TaxID=54673 RepID=A0A4Z1HU98_9HELO|nr:hypothetical protein BCON_0136g00230 [Botryotinia convoluta]